MWHGSIQYLLLVVHNKYYSKKLERIIIIPTPLHKKGFKHLFEPVCSLMINSNILKMSEKRPDFMSPDLSCYNIYSKKGLHKD